MMKMKLTLMNAESVNFRIRVSRSAALRSVKSAAIIRRDAPLARRFGVLVAAFGLCYSSSRAEIVRNPTRLTYTNEPVLLRLSPPDNAPTFHVARAGEVVPSQAEIVDGRRRVWALVSLGPGEEAEYEIRRGAARAPARSPVAPPRIVGDARQAELDNGRIAVRVGAGGPLLALRIGTGPWRGRSLASADTSAFERVEIVRGDVFVEAVVIGEYPNGGRRRFAVRLYPDRPYARITETHENAPDFAFDMAADWPGANRAVLRRWYSGPFQAAAGVEDVDLSDAVTRIPEAILRALPRWTQSYDEGWLIGIADERELCAALPIRAGRWIWPHDNALTLSAPPSAGGEGRAGLLRGAALRGARQWLLLAGERSLADAAGDIAMREGFAPLDKLHNDYILDWPGLEGPAAAPIQPKDFYSNQTNPTDVLRRFAREELKRVDQPSRSLQDLYDAQAYLDPDWYGTYENFWSPINPNFYTDFIKLGVLKTARLREHPRFSELRRRAEAALRADLAHSVTLPGGAGQECPGYLHHAAEQWTAIAPAVGRYLGFDLKSDPRWTAVGYFLAHSSVPVGGGNRRMHPAGDTHPDKPDPLLAAQTFGYRSDPRFWRTEELPGFGVIFRHRSGENDETFLSLKAGPNRGHYHGDSLSFHLAFNARDVAPDHRVSYFERPGQEHLHNRVAFRSPRFEFANMDGFERLIAFKTSERADIAVAQIESPRLRAVRPLPPEEWDQAYPQQVLSAPLVYRRTVVFVRRGEALARDTFILRDQFWADPRDEIEGRYYLHVKGQEPRANGRVYAFGALTLVDASPSPGTAEPFAWTPQRADLRGEATRGVRIAVSASAGRGEIVTVLWPGGQPPPVESAPGLARIGGVEVRWGGGGPDAPASAEARENGRSVLTLAEADTDFDRSQGDIGLFVPSVGYPFGPIPDWLIRQRAPRTRGER